MYYHSYPTAWREETALDLKSEDLSLISAQPPGFLILKTEQLGTSLVVQQLRIRLPMQGTQVRALVQEDLTCRGATKPMHHNYWACVPRLLSPRATTAEACVPRAPWSTTERSHSNEKLVHHNKEQPPLVTTRESPHTATKTQCSQ